MNQIINYRKLFLILSLAFVFITLVSCGKDFTDFEHVQRAKDFEESGKIKESIIELKNALQKNSKNTEARWILGKIYVNLGLGEYGEKELRRSIEFGLNEEVVVVPLIRSLLLQRHYRVILDEFNPKDYQDSATSSDVYALRAEALLAQNEIEKAGNEIEKARKLNPEGLFARLEYARYLLFKREYDKARVILETLTQSAPEFVHGWKLLGDLESIQNNLVAAESAYSKAIENSYQNSIVRMRRAFLRLVLENYAGAEKDINHLKKLAPDHYKVLLAQGILELKNGHLEKAISSLQKSRKQRPDHIPTLYYLGVANYMTNNFQQAENLVNHVISNSPNYTDARRLLGQIRLTTKDYAGAITVLQPLFTDNPDDTNILLMLGYAEIARGNIKEGLVHMKRVAQISPESPLSRIQYGLALLEGGDHSQGLRELEAALNLQPENKDIQAVLLGSMLKTGAYDAVLEKTKQISLAGEKSVFAYNSMGVAYLSKGDIPEARKAFTEAINIDASYPDAAHNLALLEIQDGHYDKARKLYEQVLVKNDSHLATLINLAKLELSVGNYQKSQKILETATQTHPESIEALIKSARLSLRFGRAAQAISVLNNAKETHSNNPRLLEVLGESQLEINEPRNAIATLEKLIAISPNVSMYHYLLAKGYIELGQFNKARIELDKALSIAPDNLLANITLSRLYMKQKRVQEAKKVLAILEKKYPNRPEVYGLKGWLAERQGKPVEAIQAYQDALTHFESTGWVVSLANAYGQIGDHDKGMAVLESWIKKYPEDFVARFTLADARLQHGQHDTARKDFEILLQSQPNNIVVLNNLSWLLRKESPARSLEMAQRAYSLAPETIEVKDTLALALIGQGQTERAIRILKDAMAQAPDNLTIQFHLAQAYADKGDKNQARELLNIILVKPGKFEQRREAEDLQQLLLK